MCPVSRRILQAPPTGPGAPRPPELIDEIVAATCSEANEQVAGFFGMLHELGLLPSSEHRRSAELFFDVIVGQSAHKMALGHGPIRPDEDHLSSRVEVFLRGYCGLPSEA